jgi:hypothetical protein
MPKGNAKPDGKMLDGKVAIVTGAARGMGKAIATRLSGAGAKLVIADIDYTGAEAMAEGLALATGDAVAVSLGAVFFGAMTYIGNGPNFMVKSIAESSGVKCPSFFGYVFKYALPILIPLFALVSWLFLR